MFLQAFCNHGKLNTPRISEFFYWDWQEALTTHTFTSKISFEFEEFHKDVAVIRPVFLVLLANALDNSIFVIDSRQWQSFSVINQGKYNQYNTKTQYKQSY